MSNMKYIFIGCLSLLFFCTFGSPERLNPLDPKASNYDPSAAAFSIISTEPPHGGSIIIGTPIKIRFTKGINTNSLTYTTTGTCGAGETLQVSYDSFATCNSVGVTYNPDWTEINIDTSALGLSTYQIKIKPGVQSLSGETLQNEYNLTVTVTSGT